MGSDTEKHFQKEELLRILGGDKETYTDIVQLGLESIPQDIEALRLALATMDKNKIKTDAHRLKGRALHLKLPVISELSATIERNYLTLKPVEFEEKFKELVEEWAIVKSLMEQD